MWLSGQFQAIYFHIFLFVQNFKRKKTQIKSNQTNETKTSEQKTTKTIIFVHKNL